MRGTANKNGGASLGHEQSEVNHAKRKQVLANWQSANACGIVGMLGCDFPVDRVSARLIFTFARQVVAV